jgi:4-amino-4-deoxy-L-arabinose transferase-like glycosyltransferase
MTSAALGRRLIWSAERLLNAWYDKASGLQALGILLLLFVAAWTAYHVLANASLDLHADSVETYAWSRHPAAGYYKHPPLGAWVAALWFAVFPATDWAYYLLAMVNAGAALFAVDLIARRYLSGDKRLFASLLLLLTPFYQFHSERFGANQMLLATWPLATFCFLRAFETRRAGWSAAAGASAALAMLGKYYSVYLVASFVIAALMHPRRMEYLKSSSPWIATAAGIAVLAPHLYWLTASGFAPFSYAYEVHGAVAPARLAWSAVMYLASAAGYITVLVAVYFLAVRPDRATLTDALWPRDLDRRMLVVLLAAQVLLPPLSAPFFGLQISGLWSMSAWFLLPTVLLVPATATLARADANRVALGVATLTLAAVLIAPAIAWIRHVGGTTGGREYYRLLGERITDEWHRHTGRPLTFVQGHEELIAAVAFYSPDHPNSLPALSVSPWASAQQLERDGWAFVCPSRDPQCDQQKRSQVPDRQQMQRLELELTPRFLGRSGKPESFFVALIPPATVAAR